MTQAAILEVYTQLCQQRDLAAYRVVGAIEAGIYHSRRNEMELTLRILTEAKTKYEVADAQLTNFKRMHAHVFSQHPSKVSKARSTAA